MFGCKHSGAGCASHTIYESRIRAEVVPPIERLLAQLKQEDLRAAVRAKLVQQEEDAKSADVITKLGAKENLERLESRLTNLEDAYLDGEIARDRYRARRDQLTKQIEELKAQLVAKPHRALPDVDQLFAMADALAGEPPDASEWRGIIVGVVDRITIEGKGIKVSWQEWFRPLLNLA